MGKKKALVIKPKGEKEKGSVTKYQFKTDPGIMNVHMLAEIFETAGLSITEPQFNTLSINAKNFFVKTEIPTEDVENSGDVDPLLTGDVDPLITKDVDPLLTGDVDPLATGVDATSKDTSPNPNV